MIRTLVAPALILLASAASTPLVVPAADARADPPVAITLAATTATAGERVTARARGAPSRLRLYLTPTEIARKVRSRYDERIHFVGRLAPTRGHGALTFEVPPLATGRYSLAVWCARCRPRFFVARSPLLTVTLPDVTAESCPVTNPNGWVPSSLASGGRRFHGNRLLAARIRAWKDAYVDQDGDGVVGEKAIWIAAGVPPSGALTVRYWRLDGQGPTSETTGISGTLGGFAGPSWASRMSFTEGCWKITGRLEDVSLSFVAKVAVRR